MSSNIIKNACHAEPTFNLNILKKALVRDNLPLMRKLMLVGTLPKKILHLLKDVQNVFKTLQL